jgi:hypothetical protein
MNPRARWTALAVFAEEIGLTQEEWDNIAEDVLEAERLAEDSTDDYDENDDDR